MLLQKYLNMIKTGASSFFFFFPLFIFTSGSWPTGQHPHPPYCLCSRAILEFHSHSCRLRKQNKLLFLSVGSEIGAAVGWGGNSEGWWGCSSSKPFVQWERPCQQPVRKGAPVIWPQ